MPHKKPGYEGGFGPASLQEFDVRLDNFTGPFDLLLRLITRRKLDLTEVALAEVTEEFLAHAHHVKDLGAATDFLVVASALLHSKSAALLPDGEDEGLLDEDLEIRDVLFARLLQYKAIAQAGELLQRRWADNSGSVARNVPLEPPYSSMLPDLRWNITPVDLAELAAMALMPKKRPDEADHVARPKASFSEEFSIVTVRLQVAKEATFTELIEGASSLAVVVTRFLVVLQLYRDGHATFSQDAPLGALHIRWAHHDE